MAAETLHHVSVAVATTTGETQGRIEQDEENIEEEEEEEQQQQHWQEQQQPAILQELLLRACQDGQVPAVQQLLQYDLVAMYKADALRLAEQLFVVCAENGSLECLRLLIRKFHHRLNINALDEDGTPCLHLAVLGQYVEMVEYLLRCGADVNARDREQHTALHWAVVCQHHDIMTLLLVNGADVDAQDDRGATSLHYAAHSCGKSAEQTGQDTALLLLQHLLYVNASPSCDDSDGRSPLLWAASAGSSTACKMLIAGGAAVDKVDKNGLSALHCAAARGQTTVVETLVQDCKASLDLCDRHGCPPLFYAISHCQLDCVRALLRLGANVGCVDARGRSASHYSAEAGSVEVVQELQAASCGYWSRSHGGELPVHTAIRRGKRNVAILLLQEADAVSKLTLTECLHLAAGVNDTETISKLLEDFSVKINAVAKYKKTYMTALDIAHRKGFKECYQYIRQRGGRHAAGLVHASARKIQKAFRGGWQTAAAATTADLPIQAYGEHPAEGASDVAKAPSGCDEVCLPTVADQQEEMHEQDREVPAADETQATGAAANSSEISGDADTGQPVNSDTDTVAMPACSPVTADAVADPAHAVENEASTLDAAVERTGSSVEVDSNSSSAADADAAAQRVAEETIEPPVNGDFSDSVESEPATQQTSDETAECIVELDSNGASAVDTAAAAATLQSESTVDANSGAADDAAAAAAQKYADSGEETPDHSLAQNSGLDSVAGPSEIDNANGSRLEVPLSTVQKEADIPAKIDASAVGANEDESATAAVDEPHSDAHSSQDSTTADSVGRAADSCVDESRHSPEELGSALEAIPADDSKLVFEERLESSDSSTSSSISGNANSLEEAGLQGDLERDALVESSSDNERDDVRSKFLPSPPLRSALLLHVERDGDEGRVSPGTVVDSESHLVQPVDDALNGVPSGYSLSFRAPRPPDVPKSREVGWPGRRSHTIAFATAADAEIAQRLLPPRPLPTTELRRRSANRRPNTAGSAATRQAAMSMSDRIRYEVQQSVREYEEKRRAGTAFMQLLRQTRRAPTFNVITLLPSAPATVHYDSNLEFPAIVTRKSKIKNVRVPWQH